MGQGPNGTIYMVVGLITQMFRRATRKHVVVLQVFNLMLGPSNSASYFSDGGQMFKYHNQRDSVLF